MSNETPSRLQLFHCPNCGAGLPVPEAASVTCAYCGSNVLVPPEYREQNPPESQDISETFVIQIDSQPEVTQPISRRSIGCILGIILGLVALSVIIGIGMVGAGIFATTAAVNTSMDLIGTEIGPEEISVIDGQSIQETIEASFPPTDIPATEVPAPTNLLLQFGSEGTGPGQFEDPRRIAVDLQGNIYVADYNTGRVQQFNSDGEFLRLVMIEPSENQIHYISDLATDTSGRFFVLRGGDILVFNAEDGSALDTFAGSFPELYYNALDVNPANNLYSMANVSNGNAMVKLDPEGNEVTRIPGVVNAVDQNEAAADDVIAVDGLGNTFFLSIFEPQVFIYDSQGNFRDRFGSTGNGPGQLQFADRLIVDGQGRIYVADNDAVEVFDSNGTFIKSLPWDFQYGSIRDIALDVQGNLYVVTSNAQVLKFSIDFSG